MGLSGVPGPAPHASIGRRSSPPRCARDEPPPDPRALPRPGAGCAGGRGPGAGLGAWGDDGSGPATGLFAATSFVDQAPVSEVRTTSALGAVSTDATGVAAVEVPAGQVFEVTLEHPAFLPARVIGQAEPADTFSFDVPLFSEPALQQLVGMLGGAVDPTQGHVLLTPLTPLTPDSRDVAPLPGAVGIWTSPSPWARPRRPRRLAASRPAPPPGGPSPSSTWRPTRERLPHAPRRPWRVCLYPISSRWATRPSPPEWSRAPHPPAGGLLRGLRAAPGHARRRGGVGARRARRARR